MNERVVHSRNVKLRVPANDLVRALPEALVFPRPGLLFRGEPIELHKISMPLRLRETSTVLLRSRMPASGTARSSGAQSARTPIVEASWDLRKKS